MTTRTRTRRRRRQIAMDGLLLGAVGAVSVVVIDSVLQRTALAGSPILMAGARVAAGVGGAMLADRLGARDTITNGIIAGPALVTTLDLGTRLIGTRRLDPPPVAGLVEAGNPWAPRIA